MFHFLCFFSFLALDTIITANSSELSISITSLKKYSLSGLSSLHQSEKENVPNTKEFFTKIKEKEEEIEKEEREKRKEEEKKIFFIKLIDSINTHDNSYLSDVLSKNNIYDFSSYHDEFGYTLLDYAIMSRNKKAISLLLEYIDFTNFPFKKNTLLNLLKFKNNQEARELYSQNRLDEFLYIATVNEQNVIVELLLSLDANPYEIFFNDESAFDIAKKSGNLAARELFENSKFFLP